MKAGVKLSQDVEYHWMEFSHAGQSMQFSFLSGNLRLAVVRSPFYCVQPKRSTLREIIIKKNFLKERISSIINYDN